MAARSSVTTGIAFAGASLLIAAVPVIAPPLSPGEVKVASDVQTELTASTRGLTSFTPDPASLATGLKQIAQVQGSTASGVSPLAIGDIDFDGITNAYFNGWTPVAYRTPDDETDFEPSINGLSGVANYILDQALSSDETAQALVDIYFVDGPSAAVGSVLAGLAGDDTLLGGLIETFFFGGGSTGVAYALLSGVSAGVFGDDGVPTQLIDAYFLGHEDTAPGLSSVGHYVIDAISSALQPSEGEEAGGKKLSLLSAIAPATASTATANPITSGLDKLVSDIKSHSLVFGAPETTPKPEIAAKEPVSKVVEAPTEGTATQNPVTHELKLPKAPDFKLPKLLDLAPKVADKKTSTEAGPGAEDTAEADKAAPKVEKKVTKPSGSTDRQRTVQRHRWSSNKANATGRTAGASTDSGTSGSNNNGGHSHIGKHRKAAKHSSD